MVDSSTQVQESPETEQENDLRSRLLQDHGPEPELVPYKGMTLEVRPMTLRDRQHLFNKSRTEDGNIDGVELLVRSAIRCTYNPKTGKRVFEDTDYESLMSQKGGVIDALTPAINRLSGADESVGNDSDGSAETPSYA